MRSSRSDGRFVAEAAKFLAGLALAASPGVACADEWRLAPLVQQSPGDAANGASSGEGASPPILSAADGRYVLFASRATNLVAGQVDANGTFDVFVRDRTTGTTQLVSRRLNAATRTASGEATAYGISDDGRYVLYATTATDVIPGVSDTNGGRDVFHFDRALGTIRLVTHLRDATFTTPSSSFVQSAVLSGDGRYVAYTSNANGLVQATTGPQANVFLWDRDSGLNSLVSHAVGSLDQAGSSSENPRISADGRYVAFESIASNVVAGDGNSSWDVFRYDRTTGTNMLASRQAGTTTPGNNTSHVHAITPNGRHVLMTSLAQNLILGQVDNAVRSDVFVFDTTTTTAALVSHASGSATTVANAQSSAFAISADGSRVAYYSHASDLGATDTTGAYADAYLWDRATNASTLVSRRKGTTSTTCELGAQPVAMSSDGENVAFVTQGTDLVDAVTDSNADFDLYTFTRGTGAVRLVSRATSAAATAGGVSGGGSIAGGTLAFWSDAADLVAGMIDANGTFDAFTFDLAAATIALASRGAAQVAATLGAGSARPIASPDGRWIVFHTPGAGVVDGSIDPNGDTDVFLRDRTAGMTWLVSRSATAATTAGNGAATAAALTPDGRWVLYSTAASDVVSGVTDTNNVYDTFLFDRLSAITTLVSRSGANANTTANNVSTPRAISADGRYVLYSSRATDVVAGLTDTNNATDVFVFDAVTGSTTLAGRSVSPNQTPNRASLALGLSTDGRWVLFQSDASNVAGTIFDDNGAFGVPTDVFLFDRTSSTTTLVSHAPDGATAPATVGVVPGPMTPDARYVLFSSRAAFAPGTTDSNGASDVFLYDRTTNASTLVSRIGASTTTPNGASTARALSDDGRWVLFSSAANNIVSTADPNGFAEDLYLFDRDAPGARLVNASATVTASTSNAGVGAATLSADGRWVAYDSTATDLVTGVADTASSEDVFVHGRDSGRTTLVSKSFGMDAVANERTYNAVLAAGARDVILESLASDLTGDVADANGLADVHVAEHRFTVSVSTTGNGTASLDTANVALGESATLALSPATHYSVGPVAGCGGTLAGNTYTTAPVHADCTMSVAFANGAPAITPLGDLVLLEDAGLQAIAVDVQDAESTGDTLSLSATSSTTARIPHPSVAPGAGPAQRMVSFQPVADANGAATITLTLSDVPGASSSEDFVVTITPVNDAPTLAFASTPRHPQGTIGAQVRPGFALVDVGPADEEGVQGIDDIAIVSVADPSGAVSPGSVDIANDGTLTYTLTGASGTAVVQANVRDDAGSQNGGQSLSATQSFSIVVEGATIFADGFE